MGVRTKHTFVCDRQGCSNMTEDSSVNSAEDWYRLTRTVPDPYQSYNFCICKLKDIDRLDGNVRVVCSIKCAMSIIEKEFKGE